MRQVPGSPRYGVSRGDQQSSNEVRSFVRSPGARTDRSPNYRESLAHYRNGDDLLPSIHGRRGDRRRKRSHHPVGLPTIAVPTLACAVRIWQQRYWAVLGFQALALLVVPFRAMLIVRARNALGFEAGVVGLAGRGYLFLMLIRIQMPIPPGGLGTGGYR